MDIDVLVQTADDLTRLTRLVALRKDISGVTLQRAADLQRLLDLRHANIADHESAAGVYLQKPLHVQPQQCVPHRRARHVERLRELRFGIQLTLDQLPGEDFFF